MFLKQIFAREAKLRGQICSTETLYCLNGAQVGNVNWMNKTGDDDMKS